MNTPLLKPVPMSYIECSSTNPISFYQGVLRALIGGAVPFLLGGSYAYNHYTGINRSTKDLDIFLRRADYAAASAVLEADGYVTELVYPHWLGKVRDDGKLIDLIFSSGNGVAEVDDAWFEHAERAEVLSFDVKLSPVEEMIWSKAYLMERERYDGADVAHLLRARGAQLDWRRLRQRFGAHWQVLLSHLTLFSFIYPAHRDLIPTWVMDELIDLLQQDIHTTPSRDAVCQGTLLSREQYLVDIEQDGYHDPRLVPIGNMTEQDAALWTRAIQDRKD